MPNQPCFFHFTSQLLTIHHEPDVQSLLVKAQLTRRRKSISSSNQKFFKNWYTFTCYNHVHRVKCPHTGARSRQYQTRRFYKNHKTNRLNCATMTPPTSSSKMPTNYEQKEVSLVLSLILKCPSAVHTQRSCLSGSAITAILTGIRPVGEADVLLVQKLQ